MVQQTKERGFVLPCGNMTVISPALGFSLGSSSATPESAVKLYKALRESWVKTTAWLSRKASDNSFHHFVADVLKTL